MTKKTRIEIALLLPTVPDARDACVQRLGDLLKANDVGIDQRHAVGALEFVSGRIFLRRYFHVSRGDQGHNCWPF